jgi:hypothetical protein
MLKFLKTIVFGAGAFFLAILLKNKISADKNAKKQNLVERLRKCGI